MTTRRELFVLSGAALVASALPAGAEVAAPQDSVKITQIRNATLHIVYGGVRFLVDPMLSDRHSWPGFEGSVNSEERNPLVHLPMTKEEIIDVDAVIVTHLHEDHWDEEARKVLPKTLPIFAQNDADASIIRGQGFSDVRVLSGTSDFNGVQLVKTGGRHGTEAHYARIGNLLGEACGVVFKKAELKTVYLAGDTIWHERVAAALKTHRPDVAILNTGYAMVLGIDGGIIMGTQDVLSVHKAAPETRLIASHMEAVNHCTVSRADLRAFARANGFADKLRTPGDGETIIV
ncbi:MBL fold metallo-hydrolase [Agrobacterium radiobacter]|uniref:MBL fold metallo-hydrolase n=1 Tax=Agrobacterium TaxID=357 RepID=UPI0019617999|nr:MULTISPECIES: MBL fold metallo-hydrolase [Agrobacterium]MDA5241556.1 MBL fold metallo-hydrolase [Agrobacterium sp. MAFF310724]MDA5249326.1 MBL fold metallo-hydrolase [Agrobacterium sp. MAFF210268]MDO3445669.1 MBL fold metallo-hydrolase [Agrobacterium sp. V1]